MVDEDHFMIKFVPNLPGGETDRVVSPAGVLRAVVALGTRGGSGVLGEGGGCKPGLFCEGNGAGDGADAGPEQL